MNSLDIKSEGNAAVPVPVHLVQENVRRFFSLTLRQKASLSRNLSELVACFAVLEVSLWAEGMALAPRQQRWLASNHH